jgi:hypothetical protein
VLLLVLLSALATLAGIAAGRRLYPESRTEAALHATIATVVLVLVPIQTLGWLDLLDRRLLAASVAVLSAVTIALAIRGRARWEGAAKLLASDTVALARLPLDAIVEAWRVRSPTFLLLPATIGIVLWTAWLAYLAPSGAWDGLWYHEPMVGLALQHGTFDPYPLPAQLQWVNGYPRTSEHLMLWTAAFTGKTLIDAVPSWMAGISLLAFVALARAHGRGWRTGAIGLGCVLLTIPGAVLQLRSTYIDVTVMAAYLAALHYATRPGARPRDLWSGAMAIAFLGGTKATGLVFAALLGGVLLLRALRMPRHEASKVLGISLAGTALVVLLVAPSYVRNVVLHDNPFWPLRVESRIFGTFEGPQDFGNMQWGSEEVLHEMFGAPTPGQDYHDTRRHAFGYSLTFVGLPLFLCAIFVLAARAIRARLGRARGLGDRAAAGALFQLALGVVPFAISPAFYWARYSLPSPGSALVAIHAWLARSPSRVLGESAVAAMGVLNLITLLWAEPGWDVTIERAMELWSLPAEVRVTVLTSQNLLPPETARMREERIGAGDVVAFDDEYSFVGNLWNEGMTSRVVWVPYVDQSSYLEALRELDAEWVVVATHSIEGAALSRPNSGYVRIATAERGTGLVFERSPLVGAEALAPHSTPPHTERRTEIDAQEAATEAHGDAGR